MWDHIFQYLKGNMETIKRAPLSFGVFIFVGLAIGWYFTWSYSTDKYSGIIQSKDATIQSKDAQIEQYKDARLMTKIIIFDGNGETLLNIGTEKLLESLKVKKEGQWDKIYVELKTKEHLPYIPFIQSITDSFNLRWDTERIGDNVIKWSGSYYSLDTDIVPQFKMEIYHK